MKLKQPLNTVYGMSINITDKQNNQEELCNLQYSYIARITFLETLNAIDKYFVYCDTDNIKIRKVNNNGKQN